MNVARYSLYLFLSAVFVVNATVIEIYDQNSFHNYVQGDQPVILDIYRSNCPPCRRMAPIFDELSQQYEGKVVFLKISSDQLSRIGISGIGSVPTFLFYKGNAERWRKTGSMPKAQLIDEIDRLIATQI